MASLVKIGGIIMPVTQLENPVRTAKATRYALEDGEPVTDHVFLAPLQIKLRVILAGPIGSAFGEAYMRLLYKGLKEKYKKATLVKYVSKLEVQENMAIVNFSAKYQPGSEDAIYTDIVLQKIKFATPGTATWDPGTDPATGDASEGTTTDAGHTGTTDDDEDGGSFLYHITHPITHP